MQALFQIVEKYTQGVKNFISPYLYGLLFFDGRKNCSSMSRGLSIPEKKMRKSFGDAKSKTAAIKKSLVSSANKTAIKGESRVLVIDGTVLMKIFAKKIDHLSVDYDGVIRRTTLGLSILVISLVCGGNSIPIDFSYWENKEKAIKSKDKNKASKHIVNSKYKTKILLAIELLRLYKNIILFDFVSMDGAFASREMINFLEDNKLKYSMRIPRNRKVQIKGIDLKLCDQPSLTLHRNERCKVAKGFYKGNICNFTVNKRKTRTGKWETVYLISNLELSAKDQVLAYKKRWSIDKSFRTMKQFFGLCHCQMLNGIKQSLHIFNVFMAYSIATCEKIDKGKKSVEEILKLWRRSKQFQNFSQNDDLVIN